MKKTCIKNLFSIMLILTLIFNSFSNFTFAKEKELYLSKSESIENSQPLEDDNKINEEPSVEESEESIGINEEINLMSSNLCVPIVGGRRLESGISSATTYDKNNGDKQYIYKMNGKIATLGTISMKTRFIAGKVKIRVGMTRSQLDAAQYTNASVENLGNMTYRCTWTGFSGVQCRYIEVYFYPSVSDDSPSNGGSYNVEINESKFMANLSDDSISYSAPDKTYTYDGSNKTGEVTVTMK